MPLLLAIGLIPVVLLVLGGYATFSEPYSPVFRRHRLLLPASWPALSILHISDLHVRRGEPRLLRVQKAALAGHTPDLVCVTGDICETVEDIDLLIDLLRVTRPRLGTYIVLGNHEHNAHAPSHVREEYSSGFKRVIDVLLQVLSPNVRSEGSHEAHAMADALRAAGFHVLHNEGRRVEPGGRTLWIAGCDSAWAGHADMQASLEGLQPGEACLALIHEPELAFDAHELGADLILAGHTHGGQVRLPFVGTPYRLTGDDRIGIASGFQRVGEGLLHITTGLGHTIPLRFRCPPEVVWLDCVPDEIRSQMSFAATDGSNLRSSC